jgi:histidyl-tRNA synthetase
LGVEAFGMPGWDIELEMLLLSADLWKRLGIHEYVTLEINNLGTAEQRASHAQALKEFLLPKKDQLDADSQKRLDTNVLRILDSKDADTQAALQGAPALESFLPDEAKTQFNGLLAMLKTMGLDPVVNTRLVRGLDYYNGMVFEWTTDKLGAQATVCAGGRYDSLSRQLGGADTPAVGFALGIERLLLMLEETGKLPETVLTSVDVYMAVIGEGVKEQAFRLAEEIRRQLPGLRVLTHCGGGKYNSQLKKAYASGARCAVILEGESALAELKLRILDDEGETTSLPPASVCERLSAIFDND